ncbi:MAG: hypothetical protein QF886_21665, partial [Planctomycetota bacterium]|nr:hypothetical protein [Planctomycetota bacterium]
HSYFHLDTVLLNGLEQPESKTILQMALFALGLTDGPRFQTEYPSKILNDVFPEGLKLIR